MQITLLKKSTVAAAAIAVAMMAGGASAATLFDGSGTFDGNEIDDGRFIGNDPFGGPPPAGFTADNNTAGLVTPGLAKCEDSPDGSPVVCSNWEDGGAVGDYSNAFELTYTLENGFFTLDWSFDPNGVTNLGNAELLYPHYVAVKQSNFFDLWVLGDDERLGGTIFTGLDDISHVSFYSTGDTPVIPLPAAGWLLLAGIGGLATMRRRKKSA
jgi:hypothetical protein